MSLRREQLDKLKCVACQAGLSNGHEGQPCRLYLYGQCHPRAGTRANYMAGVLTLSCLECNKRVAEVEVAP